MSLSLQHFWKSNEVATRDEPLKDVVGGLLISGGPFFGYLRVSSLHLSTVRHESPSCWIFKSKDVLESQDADLEMSQGSYVPKNLSTWRTMPLKSSKILSNPFKSFEILPISIVWQIVVLLKNLGSGKSQPQILLQPLLGTNKTYAVISLSLVWNPPIGAYTILRVKILKKFPSWLFLYSHP